MTEEKVTFDFDNFERGARAVFVKEKGAVACEVKAAFSINSKDVVRRYATHSFVEFADISVGACWVKKAGTAGCLFLLTNAPIEGEALREIARNACVNEDMPIFLYANAKCEMTPLTKKTDARFQSLAAVIEAAAHRVLQDETCEK